MTLIGTTATITAAVTTGLTGGVYLAFTTMVMPALHGAGTAEAVATMQRVNVAAVRAPFMIVFFGSAATAVAAAIAQVASGHLTSLGALRLIGAGLAVGAFAITVAVNVPLNDALAATTPGTAEAATTWARFEGSWGTANLVRGLASIAATAALVASLPRASV